MSITHINKQYQSILDLDNACNDNSCGCIKSGLECEIDRLRYEESALISFYRNKIKKFN